MLTMASRLLVLNAGSSSLKFKVFSQTAQGSLVAGMGGVMERIGDTANSALLAKGDGKKFEIKTVRCSCVSAISWSTSVGF